MQACRSAARSMLDMLFALSCITAKFDGGLLIFRLWPGCDFIQERTLWINLLDHYGRSSEHPGLGQVQNRIKIYILASWTLQAVLILPSQIIDLLVPLNLKIYMTLTNSWQTGVLMARHIVKYPIVIFKTETQWTGSWFWSPRLLFTC